MGSGCTSPLTVNGSIGASLRCSSPGRFIALKQRDGASLRSVQNHRWGGTTSMGKRAKLGRAGQPYREIGVNV